MGAVYFYHLTDSPLEGTLPMLLAKATDAGWTIDVRGTTPDRLDWLDRQLWLGPDDGFLPHGVAGGAQDGDQAILLTLSPDLRDGVRCLVSVDGAAITAAEVQALDRAMVLFDGADDAALNIARGIWKTLTDAGCAAMYWAQDNGRWVKKAEKGTG